MSQKHSTSSGAVSEQARNDPQHHTANESARSQIQDSTMDKDAENPHKPENELLNVTAQEQGAGEEEFELENSQDETPDNGSDSGNTSSNDSIDSGEESSRRFQMWINDVESRKKLVPKRAKQYKQYMNIMEERVLLLEERCNWLDKCAKKPGFSEDQEKDAEAKLKKRILKAQLNPQFWPEYQSFFQKDIPNVIDILIGEPDHLDMNMTEPWSQNTLANHFGLEKLREKESQLKRRSDGETSAELDRQVQASKGKRLPDRIRINSKALQYALRRCLGSSASRFNATLLHPFKPLIQFEEHVKMCKDRILRCLEDSQSWGEKQSAQQSSIDTEDKAQGQNGEKENTENPGIPQLLDGSQWSSIFREINIKLNDDSCNAVASEWSNAVEVRQSFDCLLEFVEEYVKPVVSPLRFRETTEVQFSDLWHLFRSGDQIITKDVMNKRTCQILKVLRTNGGRRRIQPGISPSIDSTPLPDPKDQVKPVNNINPFCIHAYFLDFDGVSLVPIRQRIVVQPYVGERSIFDLEVYPIEYALEKAPEVKDSLVKRGKNFIKYAMSSSLSYCNCKGEDLTTKEELDDKVIVDMREYYRIHTPPRFTEPDALDFSETSDCPKGLACSMGLDCFHGLVNIVHDQLTDKAALKQLMDSQEIFKESPGKARGPPSKDDDFALCSYRLFAYELRSRAWVEVHVDDLHDVQLVDNAKGFERLVLPQAHKDIIVSQVKEHFRKKRAHTSNAQDDLDLVRGKGQGLIMLLHGAPGVGKTCTAETIADLVQKPLYPITCGDLGSTAREVEQNLKQHFTLASRWDCVMLLDEADVFLAKRKTEDIERNSIVSVFLRIMEYYKGLLFLTTNRVGTFDEAFKSRVHISLFYKNFDQETTVQVWKAFISQTKDFISRKGWKHFKIREQEIIDFAHEHWENNEHARWNGRQIRNAFHTAIAMAEFDAQGDGTVEAAGPEPAPRKVKLGRRQFAKIASTVKDFDRYMIETMGSSYEQRMDQEKIRKADRRKDTKRREQGEEMKGRQQDKGGRKARRKSRSGRGSSRSSSSGSSSDSRSKKKAPKRSQAKSEGSNSKGSSEDSSE